MRWLSRAEEGEDGEYSAVGVGCLVELELQEDGRDMGLDGSVGDVDPFADRLVRQPLGDESQHVVLARAQLCQRIVLTPPTEQAGHNRLIDHGLRQAGVKTATV